MSVRADQYDILDQELRAMFAAMPLPWPTALGALWLHHVERCHLSGDDPWMPPNASEQLRRMSRLRRGPSHRRLAEVAGWTIYAARTLMERERSFLDAFIRSANLYQQSAH